MATLNKLGERCKTSTLNLNRSYVYMHKYKNTIQLNKVHIQGDYKFKTEYSDELSLC